MPTIADYVVIQETAVTLPKSNGDIDHDYPVFSATDVSVGSRSILQFRVNPSGTVTLEMRLNGTIILTQTFDSEPQRSWHEIVEQGAQDPLGLAVVVDVRGVHQGAAQIGERHQLARGLVGVRVLAPGHRAQADPGHPQTAVPEVSLLHGGTLCG